MGEVLTPAIITVQGAEAAIPAPRTESNFTLETSAPDLISGG